MTLTPEPDSALLIVDVQNDFCPGGSLAVAGGDEVVPVMNRYAEAFAAAGRLVIADRDYHPGRTTHFVQFGGAWPPHCVQGTYGAEYHPDLVLPPETVHVVKGMGAEEDAYSVFQGRDAAGRSFEALLAEHGIRKLYVGGLATDYCVKAHGPGRAEGRPGGGGAGGRLPGGQRPARRRRARPRGDADGRRRLGSASDHRRRPGAR